MDGLTKKITQGNGVALGFVKTLLTTPTLINLDPAQGMPYAVPLETETYQESLSAEVSESLVISTDHKQNVSDNVAPGSWSWSLSGYIPGNKALEPTNYFTPFVRMNTDIIRMWAKKGAVLVFKDGAAIPHKRVVIKDLQIAQQKDCRNKTPFSMTLKEINVMESELLDEIEEQSNAALKAMAEAGSALGAATLAGTSMATVVINAAYDSNQKGA